MDSKEVRLQSRLRMFVWRMVHLSLVFITLFFLPPLPLLTFVFFFSTILTPSSRDGECCLGSFDGCGFGSIPDSLGFSGRELFPDDCSETGILIGSDSFGSPGSGASHFLVLGFKLFDGFEFSDLKKEVYKNYSCCWKTLRDV